LIIFVSDTFVVYIYMVQVSKVIRRYELSSQT